MKFVLATQPQNFASFWFGEKRLPFKKGSDGKYRCEIDVDADYIPIRVEGVPEIARKNWFTYALVFWIVGIMGLFTPKYRKNEVMTLHSVVNLQPGETYLTVVPPNGRSNHAALRVLSGICYVQNGEWILEKKLVKRRKLYRFFSFLGRVAVIAAVALIIIL